MKPLQSIFTGRLGAPILSHPFFVGVSMWFSTDLFEHRFIEAKKKSPYLLIVLHGKGDSLKPFEFFNRELKIHNINYLMINAKRRYAGGFSWYGEPPFLEKGVKRSREKLFNLLKELEKEGFPASKIFLLGFSQGALMSADLGIHYKKSFAGIISVSGYFHFFKNWRQKIKSKRTPFLFTHGKRDKVLLWQETYEGMKKLESAGVKTEWHLFDKKHDFTEDDLKAIRKWLRPQIK